MSYTAPDNSEVDFTLSAYTPPDKNEVGFTFVQDAVESSTVRVSLDVSVSETTPEVAVEQTTVAFGFDTDVAEQTPTVAKETTQVTFAIDSGVAELTSVQESTQTSLSVAPSTNERVGLGVDLSPRLRFEPHVAEQTQTAESATVGFGITPQTADRVTIPESTTISFALSPQTADRVTIPESTTISFALSPQISDTSVITESVTSTIALTTREVRAIVPVSDSTDPVQAAVDILTDPQVAELDAVVEKQIETTPKARANRRDDAIYVSYSGTGDRDRFAADGIDIEYRDTVTCLIKSLESERVFELQEEITGAFNLLTNDNYRSTEFHSIEPTSSSDVRDAKIPRNTSHFEAFVEIEFHRLNTTSNLF